MAVKSKIYEDNYMFSRDEQSAKLDLARSENKFDKNFLKSTISVINNMTDDQKIEEYKKFLKNPYTYIEEFDPDEWE